ncbi:MAG: TolB-like 6-bladed beta-propeller domain-containing protein [Bacteroidales bacterium]|jgi:hypothetical protein|nr:TolB-like 6-bladed beta-propeller domain-containing protein [Bacteroidales bacterium]
MRKIFVTSLLFIFWACNNNKNISIVDSFTTKQALTHKVFEVQNGANELLNPYSIAVSGNTMTTHNFRTPNIFTTIDIATGRIIKHWGTMGQGPNEFLGRIDMYNNYLGTGLNIWDDYTRKLYFFSNSNLEHDSIYFQNIAINIKDDELNIYDSVIQLDTFVFFASGGNNDKLFTLFDTKNNETKGLGDFPPEDKTEIKDLPPLFKKMAYNGRVRYNSSLKKLVYVSIASEMFEIYNFDGSGVELSKGNYSTIPEYKEVVRENGNRRGVVTAIINGRGNNMAVTVSDENIFILYQDYERLGMESEMDYKLYADIVLVFDWNGEPVKIYELDSYVSSITYDKTRNRLWAVHNNPDPEIIYFEL